MLRQVTSPRPMATGNIQMFMGCPVPVSGFYCRRVWLCAPRSSPEDSHTPSQRQATSLTLPGPHPLVDTTGPGKEHFSISADRGQVEQDTGVSKHQSHRFLESSGESSVGLCASQSLLTLSSAFPLASASIPPCWHPLWDSEPPLAFQTPPPTYTLPVSCFYSKAGQSGSGVRTGFSSQRNFPNKCGNKFPESSFRMCPEMK